MIRQIATLLSGNALSQMVNVATILFVVIAYFSPTEFGRYALLMSYVGILSVIACWRYELSIVATARDIAANNLVFAALAIAMLTSVVLLMVLWLLVYWIGDGFLAGVSATIVVALVFLKAADQVIASILYRRESYLTYSVLKLVQALVLFAGFTAAGIMGWGLDGLLYSTMFGYASFGLAGLIVVSKYDLMRGVRWDRMSAMLKKNVDFVKYNSPQAVIDNLLTNGLNVLLAALAGPVVVGYFGYMQRILRAPLGLVLAAVSQVTFRFCAKNFKNPQIVVSKLTHVLALVIGILTGAGLLVIAAYTALPEIRFFDDWAGIREYIFAFAVWMMVPFVFSPFATLPIVYDRQRTFFQLATSYNLLSFVALGLIIWQSTVITAFWVVGLASLVYFIGLVGWSFRMVEHGQSA